MKSRPSCSLVALALLLGGQCTASATAETGSEEARAFFESRIRPVLVEHCYQCHSAQANPVQGGLRLDTPESLRRGGDSGPAVVPGRARESLLMAAVRHESLEMPPAGRLPESVIADLAQWIDGGAVDTRETQPPATAATIAPRAPWSLQPLRIPACPPAVPGPQPQSAIDLFVAARLADAGLTMSPPADRRTLLRRVSWDLVGLPPTLADIEAFEQDAAPDAYVRVVDRLLASPAYGERWGRHWLDVARYADSKDGVLMYGDDRIRPYAYTYRDYVIRALNEDLPFDRFVHEQLAADLLEPPVEPWRLAALGFLTLGRMFDNNVHDVIDDQIDVVSRGLLGLTVTCARCHDHKYDAVTQADYYALYGVFASCESPLELPRTDDVDRPEYAEFEQTLEAKRREVREFLDSQYTLLAETARQRVGDYLVRVATTKPDPLETAIYFLSLAPEDLRPPMVARWRRLLEERAQPEDPVFGPWHDLLALSAEQWQAPERVAEVLASWQRKAPGTQPQQVNPLVLAALNATPPTSPADVARCYADLLKRVYDESKTNDASSLTPTDAAARQQLLEVLVGPGSPTYFPRSQTRRYMSRKDTDAYGGKLQELDRMAVQAKHAPPRAMVLRDAAELHAPRVFLRGNPARPGTPVPRRFLTLIAGPEPPPFSHGSGRLDLARAITDSSNPLTPRVLVNRVWMQHFGEPLVAAPSDFGNRTAPPSHPELLDYLAAQLIEDGWSLKRLHRGIVLSATYQQSSLDRPECRRIDPDNRWLWRMNRRRLDWESMRDSLLAVSGRLQTRSGGRPVDVVQDAGCNRRTVYGLVDRQSLPSVLRAFDFASPDQSVERRPFTTTPQQALFSMNSPFIIEQARSLMQSQDIAMAGEPAQRVAALFRRVLLREPAADELHSALAFLSDARPEPATGLGSWELLAQTLLMTNELMFVD